MAMIFARLDPFLLSLISWALLMLILSFLPRIAARRSGRLVLQDPRLVVALLWIVRTFMMLTLLLLAGMAQRASDGLPDLPRDVTVVQPDRLLEWVRGESAWVHRLQDILFAALMYLALQTLAFGWLTSYRRAGAEPVSAP
jgi:hypothetical protein